MRRRLCVPVVLTVLFALLLVLSPARPAVVQAKDAVGGGTVLVDNGDAANRITLVLLGDGYTSAQLPAFRTQAAAVWKALTAVEPFRSYQYLFDVRRVDVVSARSGLKPGSPLGMHFGCEGTPRLLCADDGAVERIAGGSGGPQYTIALADSAVYGGEGGDGTTTLAAASPYAGRIVQHEMGHTVGGLGDEYDSAPSDADYPNLSTAGAALMRADQVKWWRWIGATDPTGGKVGAYRSANGLYRPTKDSIMRTLGGVYNLPSREAIIESIYRQVRLVDRTAPAAGAVDGRPRLQVFPVRLAGQRWIQVSWQVDGHAAPAAAVHGGSLDTGRLTLVPGRSTEITAMVRDTTPWVRDETFRRLRMTSTVRWSLSG
ncbi:M64 family metallopeptidase [Streptacidiphilus sp. N1-12]|uniref:M64 family metallopeptidase n=2 Tax=Streptacidiphilus alkalitolerans TaxID=3342712 RepID=A0ABV6WDW0_9ACTN